MVKVIDHDNQFGVDLLAPLRNEKFSLPTWVHFLGHSWVMSLATADANSSLNRSWTYRMLLVTLQGSLLWHRLRRQAGGGRRGQPAPSKGLAGPLQPPAE